MRTKILSSVINLLEFLPRAAALHKRYGQYFKKSSDKNTAKKTASHEPYLAVIHRLDQPVEGLLVFAKTPAAARELSHQLTTSGFGKYYRAQALGIFEHSEGTLEDYLVKDGTEPTPPVSVKKMCLMQSMHDFIIK